MSGLALLAALAAQAATQTGAPPPTPAPGPVAAETTAPATRTGESNYVDLEAGAGYSTNPILSLDSNDGSAFGRISAHAVHTRVSDRTTTVLSGFAQSVFYTRRYGSAQSFDLNGRHDAAVNEKLRVFVAGDAAYDRGGQLDTRILGVPNVPLLPGTIVPPGLLIPGADFLTVTGRSYRASVNAGGQLALGPRDFMDLSSGIEHDIFKSGSIDTHYTTVPVTLGYDRQLNPQTTVGARVAAQFTRYSGTLNTGTVDSRVITPELTGQFRLSERLTLSGDVGASFSSVDDGIRTRHSTGFAGDANLCSTGERTQFCGRASIQQQAATSAGPARVINVGVDYSRRLTADDTLQLSVSGNRYSNPTVIVSGISFNHATYFRAAADYSRHLGNRWYGGVNLAARKLTQTGRDPDADLSAALFIRYRLGDVQ
jgi:hypothetical protein